MDDHSIATVHQDPTTGELIIRSPYDEEVIAAWRCLPRHQRRWDPANRVWRIDASQHDHVVKVLDAYGYDVTDTTSMANTSAGITTTTDAFRAVLDAVPEKLRKPIYRSMMMVVHPDKGGDAATTRSLIEAGGR